MNKFKAVLTGVLIICILSAVCACTGELEPSEVPTYMVKTEPADETYTEYVTYPDISVMCPETLTKAVPFELPQKLDVSAFKGMTKIAAKDSYMPDSEAPEIYKNGANQYFVFSDKVAFMVFTDSADAQVQSFCYSAYYKDEGNLHYIGDQNYGWYFDNDGNLDILVYSYWFYGQELGNTFYDATGKRIGSLSNGVFYDGDMNALDEQGKILLLQRLGDVAELYSDGGSKVF